MNIYNLIVHNSFQFGLVCGQEYLVQLASTLFMGGVLFGALASGVVSDR